MKAINKTMTHGEIYAYAIGMTNSFNEEANDVYMPGALAFAIQKNKAALLAVAEDVEKGRLNIIKYYSSSEENGNYVIDPEKVEDANRELEDLLNISEEIKIYQCKPEELGDVKFTSAQMQSLMFMIDEE